MNIKLLIAVVTAITISAIISASTSDHFISGRFMRPITVYQTLDEENLEETLQELTDDDQEIIGTVMNEIGTIRQADGDYDYRDVVALVIRVAIDLGQQIPYAAMQEFKKIINNLKDTRAALEQQATGYAHELADIVRTSAGHRSKALQFEMKHGKAWEEVDAELKSTQASIDKLIAAAKPQK